MEGLDHRSVQPHRAIDSDSAETHLGVCRDGQLANEGGEQSAAESVSKRAADRDAASRQREDDSAGVRPRVDPVGERAPCVGTVREQHCGACGVSPDVDLSAHGHPSRGYVPRGTAVCGRRLARTAPDEDVRATAQQAVVALMPSEDAAQRAIAGEAPFSTAEVRTPQKEQAAGVIALFKDHVAAKRAWRQQPGDPRQQGPKEHDLLAPTIAYIGTWGGESATDLDEVGLAAAMAVGAICRFLEIEPAAGPKFMSFNDAKSRVAEYDAARDRCF